MTTEAPPLPIAEQLRQHVERYVDACDGIFVFYGGRWQYIGGRQSELAQETIHVAQHQQT